MWCSGFSLALFFFSSYCCSYFFFFFCLYLTMAQFHCLYFSPSSCSNSMKYPPIHAQSHPKPNPVYAVVEEVPCILTQLRLKSSPVQHRCSSGRLVPFTACTTLEASPDTCSYRARYKVGTSSSSSV
ncbi:hypothetical protein P175DRAFT_0213205 [Aspergillus ochraceoroseus IBT 24754]|uniref:Uncharacterized protein n=1 Tax=Aspergillus ochraceoroseus IBT 24754 TaxID=1392256 RepID=A0A2T5M0T7_9EURO|nr:uncharacterized protein P175DRAFT_0213205 [Aspergillus ochraceoroseus IBT 24754]PTU22140.1 hypothetical protein P175DRAFT_0213205 [Aspergillus ochraceoroseus IBT 24754]